MFGISRNIRKLIEDDSIISDQTKTRLEEIMVRSEKQEQLYSTLMIMIENLREREGKYFKEAIKRGLKVSEEDFMKRLSYVSEFRNIIFQMASFNLNHGESGEDPYSGSRQCNRTLKSTLFNLREFPLIFLM